MNEHQYYLSHAEKAYYTGGLVIFFAVAAIFGLRQYLQNRRVQKSKTLAALKAGRKKPKRSKKRSK
ncbi:MAG: hypothetical protein H7315_10110 [Herminiimonas sp.]|nr:hypothetical protein [Herminiimonas sp.]